MINTSLLQNWPNTDVPNFQANVMSIYKCLSDLALRVLSVMAVGLGLVRKTKNNKSFHIFSYLCVFLLQLIIAWKLTLLKMALYVYQSIFISNSQCVWKRQHICSLLLCESPTQLFCRLVPLSELTSQPKHVTAWISTLQSDPPYKILATPLSLINACIHMWLLYFLECISLRKQLTFSSTTNGFPCEMTAEEQSQKFHNGDMSQLLRSGFCFWPVEAKCQLFFQAIATPQKCGFHKQ